MSERIAARWYFDLVSPYAYLQLRQFDRLHPAIDLQCVPVLFAGLLRHWGTKGPVEVPAKRLHTYRQCIWEAQRLGVAFLMPPRHPFSPLPALRLLTAMDAPLQAVQTAFDFVWAEGRDAELEFAELAQRLQMPNADVLISDPSVKQRLIDNTAAATDQGVFGVPTFIVRDELFWGNDTLDWLNAFAADPSLFESDAMRNAKQVQYGTQRK